MLTFGGSGSGCDNCISHTVFNQAEVTKFRVPYHQGHLLAEMRPYCSTPPGTAPLLYLRPAQKCVLTAARVATSLAQRHHLSPYKQRLSGQNSA